MLRHESEFLLHNLGNLQVGWALHEDAPIDWKQVDWSVVLAEASPRSWLAIVPQSVLTPKESDEKQFLMPPQPPTTTNTLVNGERNLISSIDGMQHVEMLPPYQGMERMEALSLLLTEHSGTVLHLGFIVRSLYGELKPSPFKVIKTRVASSLTQGVEQRLWARVTDSPGCYTLDLKLIEP